MRELWKRFKELTGYNGEDIAKIAGTSRQHISYITCREGTSITHQAAVGMWICMAINQKIDSLMDHVKKLEQLKSDIHSHLITEADKR